MWFGGICFGSDKENRDEKNYADKKYFRGEENVCFIFGKIYNTKEEYNEQIFGVLFPKAVVGENAEKYTDEREGGCDSKG